jgi:hypothetical protein
LQLFQLGIESSTREDLGLPLTVEIFDALGNLVDRSVAFAGELGTSTTLLPRGEYTLVVSADANLLGDTVAFELLLGAIDTPLGIEPVDPTEDPYCGYSFIGLFQCLLILGDVNGDGVVDFSDFLDLSGNYGKEDATLNDGDLDRNQTVDFGDFLILSANFGQQNPDDSVN